jgi:hypothetical protein
MDGADGGGEGDREGGKGERGGNHLSRLADISLISITAMNVFPEG